MRNGEARREVTDLVSKGGGVIFRIGLKVRMAVSPSIFPHQVIPSTHYSAIHLTGV